MFLCKMPLFLKPLEVVIWQVVTMEKETKMAAILGEAKALQAIADGVATKGF